MLGQLHDVVATFPQRRNANRKHAQPIKQILAKAALQHEFLEIPIRRRDDAHVDRPGDVVADALELAFLQNPQQLALQLQRNFADFVEKNRTAVGELETSDPILVRSRERALHVPEKLALEQLLGYRRAVHLDQWCLGARALRVDGARHEFLADTGFAENQHVRRRLRDGFDLRQHLSQRGAAPDDSAKIHRHVDLLAEVVALVLELFPESRVLCQRNSQFALRAVALGHVLGRDQPAQHAALFVAMEYSGHHEVENAAVARHHLALLVHEFVVQQRILASAAEPPPIGFAVEVDDRAADDLFALIAHLLQPVVRHRRDEPVRIDGVQHGGRRSIQIAVLAIDPGLLGHLDVHGNRADESTVGVEFDDGIGQAIDDFAAARPELDDLVFQPARPTQRRQQLLFQSLGALVGDEFRRPVTDHLLALVAEPRQKCVVQVAIAAVGADRRGHRRQLAKQPRVIDRRVGSGRHGVLIRNFVNRVTKIR